jgi:hypothetical protein
MPRTKPIVLMCALALWAAPVAAQTEIERARALYNAGQFEDSIAAAASAAGRPNSAASAALIAARSRLERFRLLAVPADLATARAELSSLDPRSLSPNEAIEWQIGVATALFFEGQLGPAADVFAAVLPSARTRLAQPEYEKLVEWRSAAMSQLAETLMGDARRELYERVRADARGELEHNPLCRPAMYWLAIASRGAGDVVGAWNAAVAGWIRAGSTPAGHQLRTDLQRFVTQTLIPERAQARTGQRFDAKATLGDIAALTEEWRALVERWGQPLTPPSPEPALDGSR